MDGLTMLPPVSLPMAKPTNPAAVAEPGPALELAVESLLGDSAYRVEVERQRAPEREAARRR